MADRGVPDGNGRDGARTGVGALGDGDVVVLAAVVIAGLSVWFAYVALQPHDLARAVSADRAATLFGWRAPGVSPSALIEPDRMPLAVAGWVVIGLIAGRARPHRWLWIGTLTVVPTALVFLPTAPRDAQGFWVLNLPLLLLMVALVALVARHADRADWLFGRPIALAGLVGLLLAAAMLASGGETPTAVAVVGVAGAVIVLLVGRIRRGVLPHA